MNEEYDDDPIVAEVRRNREELLADFGGDMEKLSAHIASERPELEAVGVRYVTEEKRQSLLARRRQQEALAKETVK